LPSEIVEATSVNSFKADTQVGIQRSAVLQKKTQMYVGVFNLKDKKWKMNFNIEIFFYL